MQCVYVYMYNGVLCSLLANGIPLQSSHDNPPLEDVDLEEAFIPVTTSRSRKNKKEPSCVASQPVAHKPKVSHGVKNRQPELVRMNTVFPVLQNTGYPVPTGCQCYCNDVHVVQIAPHLLYRPLHRQSLTTVASTSQFLCVDIEFSQ